MNVGTITAVVSQTLIPVTISRIIDKALESNTKSIVVEGFFIIVLLGIIDLLSNMSQRFSSVRFSQNMMYDIRQDLYETLQYQELGFYSKETVGQIMSRTIEEVFSLRDILTWGYRIANLVTFLFIASFIVMLQISFELSIIFLIIPVIIIYIIKTSSSKNLQLFYDARFKYGEMNEVLAENLSGIQTVKSFGKEEEQIATFNVKNQEFYDAAFKTVGIRATLMPGMIFLISMALISLVFIGGVFVSRDLISPGNFVAFMLLVLQIAIPGRFIGWFGIILQDANSAAVRLNEIFNAPDLVKDKIDAKVMDQIKGEITFRHVSFDYPQTPHTLHDINITIPNGQKVALLGPTGAGKSSLINLIPRFFDPTTGSILIDGIDIRNITKRSLRSHIGIVHQEAYLFTLSIYDNIAFGNANATKEEVIAAAQAAQIHDFVSTLEEGYDTIVGERGVTLSGGQRQRVTLARTLVQNPKILIFDDSVTAVDPETEAKIQSSLQSAATERTTIIISQRPSSLRYVDRIIVLDNGHVVQDGTHTELQQVDGIYQQFLDALSTQIQFLDWDEQSKEVQELKSDAVRQEEGSK
jgi:ABC-type multidrug transport system fused ATPase/permease subunit